MDAAKIMTTHNHHDNLHQDLDFKVEVPEAVDSDRSPQLDKVKSRDRCGCACTSSRGASQIDSDDGGGSMVVLPDDNMTLPNAFVAEVDNTSEDGSSICGDEGLEQHSIEVDNHGMVRLLDIHIALARHSRCTCHSSIMGSEHHHGSTSESMIVEVSSDSDMRRSLLSSLSSRSLLSRSTSTSALVAHVGSGDGQHLQLPLPALHNYVGQPIWLGHELDQCSNMIIGGLRYPVELSISGESVGSDFSEYDIW
nr:hypothetical protein CFP56_22367 [Quercus suber]